MWLVWTRKVSADEVKRLKILSWDFSWWYNNRSQELGGVPGTKTPKITTLSAVFVCICVSISKFTLQMRQIWLWVKFYHPITSYFLRYVRAYLSLIHNDWQSSRATQPNTTAHTCSQTLPLACLKAATEAFLTVRAICLNLVEQGRQSWLQLSNLNVAALSPLMLSLPPLSWS